MVSGRWDFYKGFKRGLHTAQPYLPISDSSVVDDMKKRQCFPHTFQVDSTFIGTFCPPVPQHLVGKLVPEVYPY